MKPLALSSKQGSIQNYQLKSKSQHLEVPCIYIWFTRVLKLIFLGVLFEIIKMTCREPVFVRFSSEEVSNTEYFNSI